jgi:hypothetical protein
MISFLSYPLDPCLEMKGPFEHYSRIYPDCVFLFVNMESAPISGIVHIPTFKLYRDNKPLETFALNAADPEKLQKSIEKHLGAQK